MTEKHLNVDDTTLSSDTNADGAGSGFRAETTSGLKQEGKFAMGINVWLKPEKKANRREPNEIGNRL